MNSWKDFCQILLLWYKGYEYQIFKVMFDFIKFDGKCEGKNRKKKWKKKIDLKLINYFYIISNSFHLFPPLYKH